MIVRHTVEERIGVNKMADMTIVSIRSPENSEIQFHLEKQNKVNLQQYKLWQGARDCLRKLQPLKIQN